jgi:isopentenyl diphosphate isomerase/L-lactate dehydrogenase-like FMN-dependent dehydrogenase
MLGFKIPACPYRGGGRIRPPSSATAAVRCDADVLKCLALGSNAVLVGRPVICGAFGGGKDGVAVVMDKFKAELQGAMFLTGTANVANVAPSIFTLPLVTQIASRQ